MPPREVHMTRKEELNTLVTWEDGARARDDVQCVPDVGGQGSTWPRP